MLESAGDLIGNKISNKIINILRTPPQKILETATYETKNIGLNRGIPKKISPEERQQITDDPRLT